MRTGATLLCVFPLLYISDGAVNVLALRDYVTTWPWGTLALTAVMVGCTMCLEFVFHCIEHKLHNQYAQEILHHIMEELKLLGIISLTLAAITMSITGDSDFFLVCLNLFEWSHMVLFIFALLYIGVNSTFFVSMRYTWGKWKRHEEHAREHPEILQGEFMGKGKNFYKACRVFKQQCIEIDPDYDDISFIRYLKKYQRQYLLHLIEMRVISWFSLMGVGLINTLRGIAGNRAPDYSKLMRKYPMIEDVRAACEICPMMEDCPWRGMWPLNVILYIAIVGYLPLFIFGIQWIHLFRAFKKYIRGADHPANDKENPLLNRSSFDNKKFFWFNSPLKELQLIQFVMIYQIYYLASLVLSMIWECLAPGAPNRLVGLLLFLIGLTPPILFMVVCPTAMQCLTVLAATGNLLDIEVLKNIYQKDMDEQENLRRKHAEGDDGDIQFGNSGHGGGHGSPRKSFHGPKSSSDGSAESRSGSFYSRDGSIDKGSLSQSALNKLRELENSVADMRAQQPSFAELMRTSILKGPVGSAN